MAFFISVLISIFLCLPHASAFERGKESQEIIELRNIQEANSKILAETVQNISVIRQELQEMKGALEETRHFFQEESQKNEKLLRDFDLRLTGIEERVTLHGEQLKEIMATPGNKHHAESGEEALYHKALSEVNTQNYQAAITLFDQFIAKHPKSTLADNAQYWKGEALFALKDYPNAVLEFQKVIKKYPKSDKIPGAVLKQGYCFFEKKEYGDAKIFLQKVIADHPHSEEAGEAREKLAKIDQILSKGVAAAPASSVVPATPPNTNTHPPSP